MQPVGRQAGHAKHQQDQHTRLLEAQPRQPIHRQRYRHHAKRQQQVARQVKTWRVRPRVVLHVKHRGHAAQQADRNIDEKHPVPGGHLDQPATQRGAYHGAHQAGNRDETHGLQETLARIGPQHRQPPHRQQQSTTQALHHARRHQLAQVAGQRTGHRADHKQGDGRHIHPPRAKTVGNPAGGWDQHGHGQRIRHHHGLHAQWAFAKTAGHGRQGGVDDGGVQRLHKEADGHQPEQHAQ